MERIDSEIKTGEAMEAPGLELIRTKKQKVWGWPAVVNFTLGGLSTGFYLLHSVTLLLQDGVGSLTEPAGYKLFAPLLTCLGFLSLTVEAGRPLRSRFLLRHLRRSWMSRETLAAAVFVPAAVIDWFYPHFAIWLLAAAAALGLIISQSFILYRARAVTAWNIPLIPYLFSSSAFATGSGLLLLVAPGRPFFSIEPAVIGLFFITIDLIVWLFYLYGSHEAELRQATRGLRRSLSLAATVGIGHLLPILVLVVLLVIPSADLGDGLVRTLAWLTGLFVIVGGVSQKAGIILEAGYLRPIVLDVAKDSAGARPAISYQRNANK
jgi:phenylacetyl-CoA:acceptor oxidoreductase subunit 2